MTPTRAALGSLTKLAVSRNGVTYFKDRIGSKNGDDITIESLQYPAQRLEPGEEYVIQGKSGTSTFGPVDAMYMTKYGNTYIFQRQ